MKVRWHRSLLLAALLGGCSLNPQPDLPSDRSSGAPGAGGSTAVGGSAGSTAIVVGPGPSGGSPDAAEAGAAASVPDAGVVGDAGAAGGGNAGAPSEAGASSDGGDAQLAPGRTK